LSDEALQVLELRGWDEDALRELEAEGSLSPQIAAQLDEMPSCLDDLRERNEGAGQGAAPGSDGQR
jgi:hypothetical protein